MPTMTVKTANLFQLHATITEPGKAFAFYLYNNGVVIEKTPYTSENTYKFTLRRPGTYRVKGYHRDVSNTVTSVMSERVAFQGFPDVPAAPPQKDYAVIGVTRTSAFAAYVLAIRGTARCYVDPSGKHVGSEFFGLPVVSTPPPDTDLIGHENYAGEYPHFKPFTLDSGAVDSLSKELHKFGAMDLYRISRAAYLEGFLEGAYYIQNFIFNKYNCRIPFKARIGEGTRMGIGGIGAVIHPDSIIGKDCVIAQNVTLGSRAGGNGTPIIGNNVFIAPGAKCFGGRIGNNVVIGANSVVLDELPDNCVVAGAPARIISRDIEKYRGYTHRPPRD